VRETALSPVGIHLKGSGSRLRASQVITAGDAHYQDEASQLIAYLLAPQEGEMVLDLCAGRGGKTLHLAALMGNEGHIVAVDVDGKKLAELARASERAGVGIIEARCLSALSDPPREFQGRFDRVLVDSPCSATGTLRRAPEIKWRLRPQDLIRSATRQIQLLTYAGQCVKRGGVLVYSTCSLMAEENEEVLRIFFAQGEFQRAALPPLLLPLASEDGFMVTLPHHQGMDGFFGALMVKNDERMIFMRIFTVIAIFALLWGCTTPGPVLYPNDHLKKVGEEQSRKDIEDCERLAEEFVATEKEKTVAKNTAAGAAAGGLIGLAGGAVVGHAGRGLGIGAASGGAAGLIRGAVKTSQPSPVYKNFVDRCLRERGYEPIGWKE